MGTLLLSASGLFCRGLGFIYRIFMSRNFGEEAMGIFQLTTPVIMLSYSLGSSGFQTAISRFTASCLAEKKAKLANTFLLSGIFFSLIISISYSIVTYSMADIISQKILHEPRCEPLLKIISYTIPLSALHNCFNGYYYGKKDTKIPSLCQIIEQITRIGSVIFLYYYTIGIGQEPTIFLCCIGALLSELISCFITFIFYFKSKIKDLKFNNNHIAFSSLNNSNNDSNDSFREVSISLLRYSLPLTFSRVIVNLLHSWEAISLPTALKAFGYSSSAALSIYGVFTGMAMSLVLFPSTFTNSASVLLLPTVSEAASINNKKIISYTIKRTITLSVILGTGFSFIFHFGSSLWGNLLFDSDLASILISQISFFCPFLYLHTTLSSIMNGLKQTDKTFFINIASLLVRLIIIVTIVPSHGISAYIWGLLLSEILSSSLCIFYLRKYLIH